MYTKITIAGNLGRDPEMRYLPDGTAVTNISLAASQYAKGGNQTIWFRVSFWGKQAETANTYLKKGSKILVDGTLEFDPETGGPRTYAKSDGSVGTSFEVRANSLVFLSSKSESEGGHAAASASGNNGFVDDNIEF